MQAGKYDRRVLIQIDIGGNDAAGDHVPSWSSLEADGAYKRWARMRDLSVKEREAAKAILRDGDAEWIVRYDRTTAEIAPERMRLVHKGRTFEIVGVSQGVRREDEIRLLTCYRPDQRGSSAPIS